MKLKIPKSFDISKQLKRMAPWVEYWARFLVLMFAIVLAVITVTSVLSILPEDVGLQLAIFLNLFIIAAFVVFLFEVSHLFRRQSSEQQESTEIPLHKEQRGRNRWALLGILALAAIILVPIFAKQRLPDPQEYQAFLTAFAGVGAWVIGIALVVFTYQQYKLRETEHRLLFEPQMLLRSGGTPIAGAMTYNNKKYPYCIEWTVLMLNTSQQPILIEFMSLRIRQLGWGKATDKDGYLSISSYHVLEPDGLEPPFQVTQTTPQRIRWIIEGYNAGQDLDDIFGDSNNRNFALIFYVQVTNPQDPSTSIFYGIISNSFRIPKDAPWGGKITTLT